MIADGRKVLYSPNSASASSLTTARVTVITEGRWK